jgi:hypothetical protein
LQVREGDKVQTGQVIGATNRLGEQPKERPIHVQEIFATLYQHMGIDPRFTTIVDNNGQHLRIIGFRDQLELAPLLRRGLLRRDPALRLVDEPFRRFVLASYQPGERAKVLGLALGAVLIARLGWRLTPHETLPPLDHGVLLGRIVRDPTQPGVRPGAVLIVIGFALFRRIVLHRSFASPRIDA